MKQRKLLPLIQFVAPVFTPAASVKTEICVSSMSVSQKETDNIASCDACNFNVTVEGANSEPKIQSEEH